VSRLASVIRLFTSQASKTSTSPFSPYIRNDLAPLRRSKLFRRLFASLESASCRFRSSVLQLRSQALRSVGDLAGIWLTNGNPALDGLSPLEAALSATGFDAALIALDQKRRELEEHERRRKQKAVAKLEALARSRYYDPEHAELWMRSSRRELGGRSPAEFTHDDATRDRCASYLPPKRSRR
jgi:Protein of unknown function (DUF2384)